MIKNMLICIPSRIKSKLYFSFNFCFLLFFFILNYSHLGLFPYISTRLILFRSDICVPILFFDDELV